MLTLFWESLQPHFCPEVQGAMGQCCSQLLPSKAIGKEFHDGHLQSPLKKCHGLEQPA